MARSINNVLTKGLSGMVGKQLVFRSWNGKVFISAAPKKPTKQSAQQKENRRKFKMATAFAKSMMKDPAKKAEYAEIAKNLKLPNAYTAAITEYMRKPEIQEVDISDFSGKAGEDVKVTATKKDFEVQEVEVIIAHKTGEIVEKGKATKDVSSDWMYKTKTDINEKELVQFTIRVRDRAGNVVEKRV